MTASRMPGGRGVSRRMAAPLRVHHLIASLTWGGAEALLAHLAAGAPAGGFEISVGYLLERDGSPAAAALRARGVQPRLGGGGSLLRLPAPRAGGAPGPAAAR